VAVGFCGFVKLQGKCLTGPKWEDRPKYGFRFLMIEVPYYFMFWWIRNVKHFLRGGRGDGSGFRVLFHIDITAVVIYDEHKRRTSPSNFHFLAFHVSVRPRWKIESWEIWPSNRDFLWTSDKIVNFWALLLEYTSHVTKWQMASVASQLIRKEISNSNFLKT
jgi:hypothetical protein